MPILNSDFEEGYDKGKEQTAKAIFKALDEEALRETLTRGTNILWLDKKRYEKIKAKYGVGQLSHLCNDLPVHAHRQLPESTGKTSPKIKHEAYGIFTGDQI